MKWIAEGRPMTTDARADPAAVDYPVAERDDTQIRAFKDDVLAAPRASRWSTCARPASTPAKAAAHARLPAGRRAARRAHPRRDERSVGPGGQRGRHVQDRATSCEAIYEQEQGLTPTRRRHRLLPHRRAIEPHLVRAHATCSAIANVRNYDGSWTEWGNAVRAPIER